MPHIHLHISVDDLIKTPYDGAVHVINLAARKHVLTPSFMRAALAAERAGKARWPVINTLRVLLVNPPPIACAACDRGDLQLGHAEECPKAPTTAH
jgi:hypothetical protein